MFADSVLATFLCSPQEPAGQLTSNLSATIGSQHLTRLQLQRDGAVSGGFPLKSSGLAGVERVTTFGDVERVGVVSNRDSSNGAEDEIVSGTHIDEKMLEIEYAVEVEVDRLSRGLEMRAEQRGLKDCEVGSEKGMDGLSK